MRARPRWRDAEQLTASLTNAERETLNTLLLLPLAEVRLLQQLDALNGGAAVYRRIARLREAGLVAELRPPIQPGRGPGLLYVTDLGMATLAVLQQLDPRDLTRRYGVRGSDVLGRLSGLPLLQACHRLLGALAMAGPGWPRLLEWEQPCRRQFRVPTAKAEVRLTLPAWAVLAWDDRADSHILLPDLRRALLRAHRPFLSRLHALRRAIGAQPRIIIATTDQRVEDWHELLESVAQARLEAPLRAWIVRWESLEADLKARMAHDEPRLPATEVRVWRPQVLPLDPVRPESPIPTTVGDLAATPARTLSPGARLGHLVLTLKPVEGHLLNEIAEHPFLPADRLAAVLGCETRHGRARLAGLRRRGLVRSLDPEEAGDAQTDELWELTVDGLRLVAARMGLPLPAAVRANGLVGGGPEEPIGRRRNLVRYLAHTLGADNTFINLYRLADLFTRQGGDDRLLEWLGPAACARRLMRPDGYGRYLRDGTAYEFYLEYDRGTTSRRDYFEKFTSYYSYVERRRFERDYHGFPMVLVITTSPAAEQRIAEALRVTSRGYPFVLPVLLTCEGLGVVSRYNPEGLLGPIWRDAWSTERRYWLPPTPVISTRARES
jgi:hypothetical protein